MQITSLKSFDDQASESQFEKLDNLGRTISRAMDLNDQGLHPLHIAETALRASINDLTKDDLPRVTPKAGTYERSIVYTDPKERFTVLVLHWTKGAITPIHGHNAWGTVGLVDGEMGCRCYQKFQESDIIEKLQLVMDIQITSGDIASVNPDPEGIHSLYLKDGESAKTVHIYGMNLAIDPQAINVNYQDPNHASL